MLFTEKYRPKRLSDLAGNPESIEKIRRWAIGWDHGTRGQPLLLYGAIGTGKTAVAYALAEEFGWDMLEMNASGLRDEESINRIAGAAGESLSLSGKRKLILLDDVDGLQGREDRGGAGAIASLLESSRQPIILTAHDLWDKKLSGIRASCVKLEFKRINSASVTAILRKVASEEKFHATEELITKISSGCAGDMRSALNDLQAHNQSGERDREKTIFEAVRAIFKSTTYSDARKASYNIDEDKDTLKMWIDENIPIEYETATEIAAAFDNLSRADIFDGRIFKRQYYGFLRYSSDLMTAGVALSRGSTPPRFVNYQFPSYIRTMGATKGSRGMKKKLGEKIGKITHCSSGDAEVYFNLIKNEAEKDICAIIALYGFEEDELAFLLGKTEKDISSMIELSEKKNAEKTQQEKPVLAPEPAKKPTTSHASKSESHHDDKDAPSSHAPSSSKDSPKEKPPACKLSDFC